MDPQVPDLKKWLHEKSAGRTVADTARRPIIASTCEKQRTVILTKAESTEYKKERPQERRAFQQPLPAALPSRGYIVVSR
jgi:hypothetical protein